MASTPASSPRRRAGSTPVYHDASKLEAALKDETPAHDQPKLKRFLCWRVTKKQWILMLIAALLAFATVFLLVFFLAIVPAIFQKHIDQVDMKMNYLDIKALPSDAAAKEIDVAMSIRVTYDSSVSSTMDSAQASLFYNDQVFGTITLPAQSLAKGMGEFDLVIQDKVAIVDAAVFAALSQALVTNTSVAIGTRVEVKAHAMGLSASGLELNRAFTVKAFHSFSDPAPQITAIAMSECTASEIKMLINITLDNESQVGIADLGRLNMSVYHKEVYLGQAISTTSSVGIPRGEAPMGMELTVKRSASAVVKMVSLAMDLLGKGAQFYITGDHPYATTVLLLQPALSKLNMSVLYTDGLSKLQFSPTCSLATILGGAA